VATRFLAQQLALLFFGVVAEVTGSCRRSAVGGDDGFAFSGWCRCAHKFVQSVAALGANGCAVAGAHQGFKTMAAGGAVEVVEGHRYLRFKKGLRHSGPLRQRSLQAAFASVWWAARSNDFCLALLPQPGFSKKVMWAMGAVPGFKNQTGRFSLGLRTLPISARPSL